MKIKITRDQWEKIGNESGWKKIAQNAPAQQPAAQPVQAPAQQAPAQSQQPQQNQQQEFEAKKQKLMQKLQSLKMKPLVSPDGKSVMVDIQSSVV